MDCSILTLTLGAVELPDSHPRAAGGQCLVQGFVITDPDDPIIVELIPREPGDHALGTEATAAYDTSTIEVLRIVE